MVSYFPRLLLSSCLVTALACWALADSAEQPAARGPGANPDHPVSVSIIQMIATPDAFDGKYVTVWGYVHIAHEGTAIYLHREDLEHGLTKNGLWLETGIATPEGSKEAQVHKRYAMIVGRFDGKKKGHLGLWSGTIGSITRMHDHFRRMLIEGHAGSEYVFCATRGGPLFGSNIRRSSLRPILKAAKLPTIRFHDLRHTSATLLLADGKINAKVVQERMGHSHVSVTLGVYAHVMPGMDADAAATFDTLLAKKSAG